MYVTLGTYNGKLCHSLEIYQNFKYTYTAVIVEPREHKALEFVLNNVLENLNEDWNVLIFHGNNNMNYTSNIVNNNLYKYKHRISMKNLNVDNLTIYDYNKLLTSKSFYEQIPTEIFLIFQTDSMICPEYKHYINEFLKYDYVGAPWENLTKGGNGGFSLRRKSKMNDIIDNCKNKEGMNEDIYFSNGCKDAKLYIPSPEESNKFSIETIYRDDSFGVHKPWNYVNIENKYSHCKDLDKLVELNKQT